MNTAAYQTTDKSELSARIFPYLVERGLENITIREVCRGTGIVQGTLYYWFKDKTGIVCEAAQYGLKTVTDEIFEYVFASLNDLKGFFANCLDEISKYKKELRFIYQLAASPVYGEKIRKTGKDFNFIYDKYTHRLSLLLDCDEQTLKPLVYLFISAVLDYVIWDEKEKSQLELNFIYSALPEIMKVRHNKS
jgi:AcrR family transcriptional regulator